MAVQFDSASLPLVSSAVTPKVAGGGGAGSAFTQALQSAIADQRKVLEMNPKSVYDKTELSQLLRESGDAAAADAELAEATKMNPEVTANWFDQQAQRLYVEKKWEKSLEFRRRALDIDPMRPGQRPIYLWLTRAWLKEADAATAEIDGKKLPIEEWNALVASFLAGKLTEEELFKAAETKDENTTKGRRCESFCFAAEKRHIAGDLAGAKALYKRSIEQEQRNFLETYLSEMRLKDLEKN